MVHDDIQNNSGFRIFEKIYRKKIMKLWSLSYQIQIHQH